MRIMLVSSNEAIHDRLSDRWTRSGHEVVVCADETNEPCRGVAAPGECPLRAHVDLAVLVTPHSTASNLSDMGFVCARRHRVATVTIDPVLAADELWQIEAEASAAQRRLEADDALAVHRHLPHASAVTVRRRPRHIALAVEVSAHFADATARLAVADRVRQAVREHDAYVDVIDIVVTCSDDYPTDNNPTDNNNDDNEETQ
jgi:hypothetical protein